MIKNFRLKKTTYLSALALLAVAPTFAQTEVNDVKPFAPETEFRTWSIGVGAGVINQWNVMGFRRDYGSVESQLGYNFYVKKQITPTFGLQAEYLGGKLNGGMEGSSDNFSTKLPWSAALSANITLANISWRHQQGVIKPYLSVGVGALNYNPTVEMNGTERELGSSTKAFIPAGLGFKFGVANGINIDLGYQVNLVNTGTLDGLSTNKKDVFSYVHAGLEFALGDATKPFLGSRNPVVDMRKEYQANYDELAAALKAQKEENEALKAQWATDLADDDGDGVANKFDKCPGTAADAKVDGAGCPLPEAKKVVQQITVTEEDKRVVDEAIKNLEFDLSKATIRSTSYPSLDKVAKLLVEKNFSLKLAGHTDNTGSMKLNMRLSKERAESVKSYLVSKGANPSRIEATGYGPTQPIATNATAEGRQANRRVEFTLY
ncbi:OmpA family protein [Olivibacter domesticus]|uniref:OmpA-OmpF porin, OOP family n=1 Tax=Olivibacter domesticus TaxID=407022 RepID=A0A1H7YGH1_OLID1|nr:OmpA family protein [Olivibacter domesticus]SEM45356.1 OmpA-OmpF porin, OOP family [Olivibacter domesticus]